MEPPLSQPIRREYAAKIILIGLFLGLFVLLVVLHPGLEGFRLAPFDLVLLGLATFRLSHLVSYDRITEPLRRPFTYTVPDSTGAGESVVPRGEGVRAALGQMIACPICSGTWIAALLVYALILAPGPTQVFLAMTAAIGLAEIINALVEALSWSGQLARTESGRKATQKPTEK